MNVYEIITNRIIEQLEAGTIPWKKSWNAKTQAPRNFTSGKLYSGINVFILLSARFQSPYWLTFKQATEKGGTVRKGEKGLPIVFWSTTEKEDPATGEVKKSGFLKYYTVFNVAQIDGLKDVPVLEVQAVAEGAEEFDQAADIVAGMPHTINEIDTSSAITIPNTSQNVSVALAFNNSGSFVGAIVGTNGIVARITFQTMSGYWLASVDNAISWGSGIPTPTSGSVFTENLIGSVASVQQNFSANTTTPPVFQNIILSDTYGITTNGISNPTGGYKTFKLSLHR